VLLLAGWALGQFTPIPALANHVWARFHQPSIETRILDNLFTDTENANIWERPPVMSIDARDYLQHHFKAFDPRVPHKFSKRPIRMFIPELVESGNVIRGLPVLTVGRVTNTEILGDFALRPAAADVVIQIRPLTTDEPLVYVRVTIPHGTTIRDNQTLEVDGLVLAYGSALLENGASEPAVYMDAAAIRKPSGWLGSASPGKLGTWAELHAWVDVYATNYPWPRPFRSLRAYQNWNARHPKWHQENQIPPPGFATWKAVDAWIASHPYERSWPG
jgi:hypothetical protein